MSKLEALLANTAIRGVVRDSIVTVVNVQWFGSDAMELTYKTPDGKVANELLYRDAVVELGQTPQALRRTGWSVSMNSISLPREEIEEICRKHRIRRLSLFGSRLKGTARPDSDVDLLAEFEPDAKPTYLDLSVIEEELSALLGGMHVDLRTPNELSRHFRDIVTSEAEVQYGAD
ncbi:MAG TPA: nucleotidyltransferase domain-containing protein [Thermoanaerobaculia bacterium]|jgi:predicted nucleotidyltransferase